MNKKFDVLIRREQSEPVRSDEREKRGMISNLFGEEVEPDNPIPKDKRKASRCYRESIARAIGKNVWGHTLSTSCYGFPVIEPYSCSIPEHFVRFDKRRKVTEPATTMLHFFMNDCDFSGVLHRPDLYIDELKLYHSVVFPDASQYMDMPWYRRMFNNCINKEIGQLWQKAGVRVVVNATWSDSASFSYCFDGLPTGCMVAVNSLGLNGNPFSVRLWRKGYEQMLERLRPSHIIRYGYVLPGEVASISTYFDVEHLKRMHDGRKR